MVTRPSSHLRLVKTHPSAELTDGALVHALVGREPWAAEAIWRRHAPAVFGFLRRALGHEEDAERLTQSVFLEAFNAPRRLGRASSLRVALYSAAVRSLRRELTARAVRRWFQAGRTRPLQACLTLEPHARLALRRFYAVLDELSPMQRAIFVLGRVEGLPAAQIALICGVCLEAARAKLERVCRRFDGCIDSDPLLAEFVERGPRVALAREGA